ncbi:MAG: hypothetical protein ACFE8Z_10540 [Candidatus Hermodarchaeota archaeon]
MDPTRYRDLMNKVRDEFNLHEEIDEERTTLTREEEERIELVRGSFDPSDDDVAMVRVVILDDSLREFFDSVFGEPYKVKM